MKLLLSDYGGYAFIFDLSCELAKRGHEVVHIYTSDSGSPQGDYDESIERLTVVNVRLPCNRTAGFVQRWVAERAYGKETASLIRTLQPDVVTAADTPLEALWHIFAVCRRSGIPFIFWWQDILGDAMTTLLRKKFGLIGYGIGLFYRKTEQECLRRSQAVIAVSERFRERLNEWGIRPPNLYVIPNWASPEKIRPLPKANDFSRRHGLADRFVVLYAGTLGMKQNPQTLIDAAKYLAQARDIVFLIAAGGVAVPFLQAKKAEEKLENLVLLPLQPPQEVPELLATGDLHVVLLTEEAARYCVPSKIWTSFCAARPVIVAAPVDSEAAHMVSGVGAGIVVDGRSKRELAEAVLSLRQSERLRNSMGENGRRYAEQNFQISAIAEQFERVINRATMRP